MSKWNIKKKKKKRGHDFERKKGRMLGRGWRAKRVGVNYVIIL